MNYRERMKEYLKEPDEQSYQYGKWAILNREQRDLIKRLLREMDSADVVIKNQFEENKRLNNIINDKKERQDIAIRLLHKLFGTDDYEINYIIGIINGQRQIKFDEELKGDDSNEL